MPNYISGWDPFRDVVTLREAMDRLFEDSFVPQRQEGPASTSRPARLPLDAYVTADEIVIVANVPGVKPEDVEITIEGDSLTIKGQRLPLAKDVNYVLQERGFGPFQRTLNINVPVDANRAEAHYENGVLTLRIPKAESMKPKTIQVVTREQKQGQAAK
jgi:HSP20 family protein